MNAISRFAGTISPLSWIITIGLDLVWGLFEGVVGLSLVGLVVALVLMPLIFSACSMGVTLVQRYQVGDGWGAALGKGILLGIMAAVPLPIFSIVAAVVASLVRGRADLDGETIHLGRLTKSWRRLEQVLRSGLPYEMSNGGIDQVIDRLCERGTITGAERDELHALRRQRNSAVHYASTVGLPELVERIRAATNRFDWRMRLWR